MEQSPVKPYLAIGAIVLVVLAIFLSWKGGFFNALKSEIQRDTESRVEVRFIPVRVTGTVVAVDAIDRAITVGSILSEGRPASAQDQMTGVANTETRFFRMVRVQEGKDIFDIQPASFEEVRVGSRVSLVPRPEEGEKQAQGRKFVLLLVTIEQ